MHKHGYVRLPPTSMCKHARTCVHVDNKKFSSRVARGGVGLKPSATVRPLDWRWCSKHVLGLYNCCAPQTEHDVRHLAFQRNGSFICVI